MLCLAPQAYRESKGQRGLQGLRVPKGYRGQPVRKGHRDFKEHKVPRELLEYKVPKGIRATKEIREILDLQDRRGQWDRQV
jgi:hypothetical protein